MQGRAGSYSRAATVRHLSWQLPGGDTGGCSAAVADAGTSAALSAAAAVVENREADDEAKTLLLLLLPSSTWDPLNKTQTRFDGVFL